LVRHLAFEATRLPDEWEAMKLAVRKHEACCESKNACTVCVQACQWSYDRFNLE